ncbi:Uncharacterized protein APZ42_007999, partial [Daphnia magna]
LTPVKDIFNVIIVELKETWGKAAIPVKDDKNILKALMNTHEAWLSLKKIPVARRDSPLSKKLIEEFQKQMDSLFDISPSDVENRLRATRKRHWKEEEIREKWNPPPNLLIHWDSKLIKYLTGKVDDRVAILVSGKPELENPNLLGIPVIASSTGTAQHDAVMSLLADWEVIEKIV